MICISFFFFTGEFWRHCDGWRPKPELSFDSAQTWSASIQSWKVTAVAESWSRGSCSSTSGWQGSGAHPQVAGESLQSLSLAPRLLAPWLCWDRVSPVIVSVGIYWFCLGRVKLQYRICEPKTREWAPGALWSQLTCFTGVSCILSAT